ncbi:MULTISPECIES: GvpL/GvpF family gas vesicle protein [unclassified Tolypothrix]|uniref:gas vesicle protein GvpF n=1 Tax=unclassified Tolypothrix TaxID=2649714 RepID=UPI0005EABB8B|nr:MULTISPECIES: GvpL/GvpF family gas vesicle protein [unclassified Tolypothrix]BAY90505.1 Gas vesicle synthesis protein GvpL/GvpF [Microchaete diplosiphon NIES-3275]EKF01070.1 gas vesicle protein, GvpL/GvpF family [Tolypothrix sp. PCC 7601]MBE9082179.1 GvpL/GvpF family gas vesicle protein [Tolypothrix sp. LEGE 11397]UYD24667.1 GvpL/GvpF family gas vesicle protein [Tolypothrix sp. PCC 7712]UYD33104.1 GvpL/GvpF family gas vesicle protein [Tolypothrix sp. PCC 7601]
MDAGLYLYGIFSDPIPPTVSLKGLDSQPVYSQVIEGFTFLYSDAKQEKYLASRRNLISHEKVLEQAMQEGFRTLLPLRFGLVVKNWETVISQLIQPCERQLRDLFQKLAGKREVSVKILWDTKAELQAMMQSNPDLKQKRDQMEGKNLSMEEVIEIGQLIESNLQQRKEAVIKTFFDELKPLAEEVVESEPMMEEMIYNAAFLIPWDQEALFSQRVEAIDKKFGDRLRIRYNNFTAPYTFAQIS